MKKFIIKSLILVFGILIFQSCQSDKIIEQVEADRTSGAILRTIERISLNYNIFDQNSLWSVMIEEQDAENGGLLKEVIVYGSYEDREDDGIDNSRPESILKTIPASEFTTGTRGLPVTTIGLTLSEALAGLGLSAGEFTGGDIFTYRLAVVLTDGRVFSDNNVSGTVAGGSFFSTPFSYNAGILCIPDTPITGDYTIDMVDNYGDGWQGSSIEVNADGVISNYFLLDFWTWDPANGPRPGFGTATFADIKGTVIPVPAGTSALSFSFVAGDFPSEVEFKIFGPAGSLIFDGGPNEPVGELELNLCKE